MAAGSEANAVPHAFRRALSSLGDARVRREILIEDAVAPQRVAPFAAALSADVASPLAASGTGRFVVLHDPRGQDAWHGTFRVVVYVRVRLDPEMATDPSLPAVVWSWLVDALQSSSASHLALGGTVTRVTSEHFGGMAGEPRVDEVEIRASWTPHGTDMAAHVAAWAELLGTAAGLPPTPPGVVTMRGRPTRRRR